MKFRGISGNKKGASHDYFRHFKADNQHNSASPRLGVLVSAGPAQRPLNRVFPMPAKVVDESMLK